MKRSKILILILIVLFIIFLNTFRKEVKNFFYLISSPIQKALWKTGDRFSDLLVVFFRVGSIEKENQALFEKNLELISRNSINHELFKENEFLRQALDLELAKKFSLILTQILSKDIDQDFILLNKGAKHGVHANSPVITSQNIVCGRITSVYPDFSKAELISNNNFSFDVAIQTGAQQMLGASNSNNVNGLAQGMGRLKLSIDLIPQETEIKEKDIIITTPLGNVFPAGLLVGEVKTAIKNDVTPFQTILANPFCRPNKIERLFIIDSRPYD